MPPETHRLEILQRLSLPGPAMDVTRFGDYLLIAAGEMGVSLVRLLKRDPWFAYVGRLDLDGYCETVHVSESMTYPLRAFVGTSGQGGYILGLSGDPLSLSNLGYFRATPEGSTRAAIQLRDGKLIVANGAPGGVGELLIGNLVKAGPR